MVLAFTGGYFLKHSFVFLIWLAITTGLAMLTYKYTFEEKNITNRFQDLSTKLKTEKLALENTRKQYLKLKDSSCKVLSDSQKLQKSNRDYRKRNDNLSLELDKSTSEVQSLKFIIQKLERDVRIRTKQVATLEEKDREIKQREKIINKLNEKLEEASNIYVLKKRITCPSCLTTLRIPANKIGDFKCPKCSTALKSYKGVLLNEIKEIEILNTKLANKADLIDKLTQEINILSNEVANLKEKNREVKHQEKIINELNNKLERSYNTNTLNKNISCPTCSSKLRIPANKIGDFRCPSCSNFFKSYNGVLLNEIKEVDTLNIELSKKANLINVLNQQINTFSTSSKQGIKTLEEQIRAFKKDNDNLILRINKLSKTNSELKINCQQLQKEKKTLIIKHEQIGKKVRIPLPIPASIGTQKDAQDTNIYVKYGTSYKDTDHIYPLIKIPKKECIVKSYRIGASYRRGYKEKDFESELKKYFSNIFEIRGDVRINTGDYSRPYEPDIALIDTNSSKNIRIDIEIDEPYGGLTRQPIHCIGEDNQRNIYFKNRGWIVIRFSEFQVHTHEQECLKFIAKFIQSLGINYEIPDDLKNVPDLVEENQWDVLQAQKWEYEKYRENYLNHEFSATEIPPLIEQISSVLNDKEKEEEAEVEQEYIPAEIQISYNERNKNPLDKNIRFESEEHLYKVNGVQFPSVTTILEKFFPVFDSYGKAANLSRYNRLYGLPVEEIVKIWEDKGIKAASDGTYLHKQIENYFLQIDFDNSIPEFRYFEEFISQKQFIPYRSEWRVFDSTYQIAGTIDLVVQTDKGYDIYDWKRSSKIVDDGGNIDMNAWGKTGIGKLEHIPDTRYNRYTLQQNIYKYILEKNYNIIINNLYIVVLHPNYNTYYCHRIDVMETEILHILKSLEQEHELISPSI